MISQKKNYLPALRIEKNKEGFTRESVPGAVGAAAMELKKETSSLDRSSSIVVVVRNAGAKIIFRILAATTTTGEQEHVQLC